MQSLIEKHLRSQGFWWSITLLRMWIPWNDSSWWEPSIEKLTLRAAKRMVAWMCPELTCKWFHGHILTYEGSNHTTCSSLSSIPCAYMSNSNPLHGLHNVFPSEEILTGRYLRIDYDAATSPSVEQLLSNLGFLQLPMVFTVLPWDVGAALLFLATIFSEGLSFVSVRVPGELRKHQNMAQKQAGSGPL